MCWSAVFTVNRSPSRIVRLFRDSRLVNVKFVTPAVSMDDTVCGRVPGSSHRFWWCVLRRQAEG